MGRRSFASCISLFALTGRSKPLPRYSENEARLFMQYARATACLEERLESWTCGEMCEAAQVVPGSLRYLPMTATWKVTGYVARIPSNLQLNGTDSRCVVAFRGSGPAMNWVSDFTAWKVSWPNWEGADKTWCQDCNVHWGAASDYAEIRLDMLRAIKNLSCASLAFTGHSLGGALAALASLEVRGGLGLHVDPVFTFAKYRVGDASFVSSYVSAADKQNVTPPMWRVVDYKDPIPRLPPTWLGYAHEPHEVYYTNPDNSAYRVCNASLEQPEDITCSLGTSLFGCLGDPGHLHNTYVNLTTLGSEWPAACVGPNFNAGNNHGSVIVLVICIALLSCWARRSKRCRRKSGDLPGLDTELGAFQAMPNEPDDDDNMSVSKRHYEFLQTLNSAMRPHDAPSR